MSIRTVSPAFVVPGVSVRTLERLPRIHTTFDERFLQDLLSDHPELLPVRDVRDDVGSLLCIGREVAVSSGAIDNLYLSTEGYPVIVETKLWRNPQARREVLSQTLDYIKEVVQRDFEWFAQQWKLYSQQHENLAGDLLSRLNDFSDDEIDEQFIVDRVNRALSRGDVIAMIVGGVRARVPLVGLFHPVADRGVGVGIAWGCVFGSRRYSHESWTTNDSDSIDPRFQTPRAACHEKAPPVSTNRSLGRTHALAEQEHLPSVHARCRVR